MTHHITAPHDWKTDPRFGTDDRPVGTLADLDALCRRRAAEIVGPVGPDLVGQVFRYERDTNRHGALTDEWDRFSEAYQVAIDALFGPDWIELADDEDHPYSVDVVPQRTPGAAAAKAHPWHLLRDDLSLAELLAEPDDTPAWRIAGVWPSGGKVVLSAPAKAGKSTLLGNLTRSLVDGDPFLGTFLVTPLAHGERVWLADVELSRDQLRRWLGDQGIRHPERVHVELFRGRADALDVRDRTVRAALAERLRAQNVRVIIVDPASPIMAALGIDDMRNGPVRAYLDGLAALAQEVGNAELLVAHHAGHDGERSRGASAWRDWPDAEWRLTVPRPRNGQEPAAGATRFLAASGRDVALAETRLVFEPGTRRLSLGDGDRHTASADLHAAIVLDVVRAQPGLSRNEIVARVHAAGTPQAVARDTLRALVNSAGVHVHPGPNRSHLHHPGDGCAGCPSGDGEAGQSRRLRAVQ